MGSPDSSTSGHTLSGTFCIQQALETKVFFSGYPQKRHDVYYYYYLYT